MNNGEFTVTVRKVDLLNRLKENRNQHEQNFQAAYAGFTQTLIEELEEKLALVKAGKTPEDRIRIGAMRPENHVDDYNEAIEMFEMSTNEQMEISQSQFRQYVRDDWGWKQQWAASNSGYIQKFSEGH